MDLLANSADHPDRFPKIHLGVTRRAELYMRVAALPLDRVLDALKTDEAGWSVRVFELRQAEARNLAAAGGARS